MTNKISKYKKTDKSDVEYFKGIVGDNYVITGGDELEPYTHDETEDFVFTPEIVLRPGSTGQISEIMKYSNDNNIAVTPRGGGTGLSGGALCVTGGVCLATNRMNRIMEIDTDNLTATVQPGVIVEELHNAVEEKELMYPPDPASRGSCTIGGNLAECAGGPRALKYGVTRDYVLGLTAVLPDGRIIRTGGKLLKNSTGYNLTQLLIGSEGTLAVITEIIVKLIPLPGCHRTLLVPFPSVEAAARGLNAIFLKKIIPCAAEFMEQSAIQAAEEMLGRSFPYSDSAAMLLIEIDGNHRDHLDLECEIICEAVLEMGALDVLLAESSARQKELWDMRRSIGEAVKNISAYKEEDTVVPRAQLPELMNALKVISKTHGFTTICYGHAGDGNIHANIIRGDMDEHTWREQLPDTIAEVHRAVVGLGGMISGEHGIGYTQKKYMPIAIGETEIELMRAIKEVFDPKGILNPDKILP